MISDRTISTVLVNSQRAREGGCWCRRRQIGLPTGW
jgi:hypothetical protein